MPAGSSSSSRDTTVTPSAKRSASPKARAKGKSDGRSKAPKKRNAQEEEEETTKKRRRRLKPRKSHEGAPRKAMKKRRRRVNGQARKTKAAASPIASNPDVQNAARICPICQEEYSASTFPVVHAPCGHVACAPCSLKWQQKKSARTCAFCRSPVLSIAHCPLLEQLMEKNGPNVVSPSPDNQDLTDPASGNEATREETKKALRELGQGDLNEMSADYRGHAVRVVAARAIRKGDLPMLEKCLQKYNARASTELLCTVAENWKAEPKPAVSLLIAHGSRVNGHHEERPLLCAASEGNTRMMSALIDLRADPMMTTGPSGETALHIAARRGRFEAARLLLDRGVPAELPDHFGQTPLTLAAQGKNMHMSYCSEGPNCERCEARIQVHGELRWRVNATSASLAPRPNPLDAPAAENDGESDHSSSEWEASDTDVSDVEEWLEGEEEEEEDGNEEDDDDDDDEEGYEEEA